MFSHITQTINKHLQHNEMGWKHIKKNWWNGKEAKYSTQMKTQN